MMTREEIILSHIKRDGLGLEIGAGCAPLAPKKQGFRVHVLDHCDKNALIEKYRPHGIDVENIEEVDFVWDGRPYTELIGRRHVYDWIIGSRPGAVSFLRWGTGETESMGTARDVCTRVRLGAGRAGGCAGKSDAGPDRPASRA